MHPSPSFDGDGVCFGDYSKKLGIGDGLGNLLEHSKSPKWQFFGIGEAFGNLLEI